MDRLPKELHHIIASYAVEPVYHLYPCLKDHINWDVLSCNSHPAMVPLIDAYFERYLSIESHLPHSMLGPLYRNPTARPLVEKYDYFFRKLKRKGAPALEPPIEHFIGRNGISISRDFQSRCNSYKGGHRTICVPIK